MRQYIVDSFTNIPFTGNPAAVCVMESWPSEESMMKLAMENNLSETAFIVKEEKRYGVTALTIISLGFAISSLSVVTSGVCEALGKGLLSLSISLIRYIVVIIPASVIFSKMWDANGVYVAFVFTEFTAALISALLMKKVLKKG